MNSTREILSFAHFKERREALAIVPCTYPNHHVYVGTKFGCPVCKNCSESTVAELSIESETRTQRFVRATKELGTAMKEFAVASAQLMLSGFYWFTYQ